jgi:protein SCO1/2
VRLTRKVGAALAALLIGGTLAGCGSSGSGSPSPRPSALVGGQQHSGPYQGMGIDPARPRPNFTLTDTDGKPFAFGTRTAGHPTLLFFGYTNCPDVCPTTMADVGNALREVPAGLQKQTYVVFVSTDVQRDTAAVLARWLKNFDYGTDATFVGLRGTQDQVDAAQAASGIFLAEDAGQTHSTQVLLYGPDDYARLSYVYTGNGDEAAQIAHDLPLVAKG